MAEKSAVALRPLNVPKALYMYSPIFPKIPISLNCCFSKAMSNLTFSSISFFFIAISSLSYLTFFGLLLEKSFLAILSLSSAILFLLYDFILSILLASATPVSSSASLSSSLFCFISELSLSISSFDNSFFLDLGISFLSCLTYSSLTSSSLRFFSFLFTISLRIVSSLLGVFPNVLSYSF